MKKINLLEPDISKIEINEIKKALQNNFISTYGNISEKTKEKIKHITKSNYVELSNSGSSALILAIKSLKLQKEEMIITSNFTFIATVNSIMHCGHIPWIFDIESKNFSINLDKLNETLNEETYFKKGGLYNKKLKKRISCIIVVFFAGIVPDLNKLQKIAKKFKLKVIVDCAGGFFSLIENKEILKKVDITITSFNGNKSLTAGSGGAIFSNKLKYAKIFSNLIDNSKSKKPYYHLDFGFNFKISNIHSAILLGQLKRYKEIKSKKNKIKQFYDQKLSSKHFKLIKSKNTLWQNCIIIDNKINKAKLIYKANLKNIMIKEFWVSMINQKKIKRHMFFDKKIQLKDISDRILPIPSSTFLKKKELLRIVKFLNNYKL